MGPTRGERIYLCPSCSVPPTRSPRVPARPLGPVYRGALSPGALLLALLLAVPTLAATEPTIVVGAKNFTEGTILGEIMAQTLEQHAGVRVERRFNLAGTKVAFDALQHGAIDAYAEYTGTGLREIVGDASAVAGASDAFARVSRAFSEQYDLVWLAPFGFNNTYVLIMRAAHARELQLASVSDAAAHPLRYGMSHEFLQREDGMPGLLRVYGLQTASLVGMEHDLAYQALADGAIEVSDGYSTDAKIVAGNLVALRDDRNFFPPYEAAPLVRRDLLTRVPRAAEALALLAGRLDEAAMRRLNHRVEFERREPADVAASFLREVGIGVEHATGEVRSRSLLALLWQRRFITLNLASWHLLLTGIAEALACMVAIPLGIAASRKPRLASTVLGIAGVLQTIPSIALLAFMLPFFGIGARPAIVALFLYGLLPIIRNTVTGLRSVDAKLIEVGLGLGMRPRQLLWQVELPLAAPVILAGVRTSSVINIGTATLAAFIGAGGLGDPIVTGLTVSDTNLVLSGALPAAALALVVDAALGQVERWATPRGLRIGRDAT
ncbi:MAG: ABC transporter permease subunit [Deltaproteobacteria bacterium]|nr:ABC transporter permease subunit [Deltaproteobacteria bacterium]MBI3387086.1 ABC transporter permease subunit [Deltaproteobacteria bacterium]